jgi:hypothetical protein
MEKYDFKNQFNLCKYNSKVNLSDSTSAQTQNSAFKITQNALLFAEKLKNKLQA